MTEIRNLCLRRGSRPVQATLYSGTVYGLTGAGSEELANTLGGILPAEPERVRVGGIDLSRARKRIGFVSRPPVFCEEQSPYEFLCMTAKLRGADLRQTRRIPQLLDLADLTGVKDRPIARLTAWQKRTLSILAATAGEPELLVLVDPFEGMDPPERNALFAVLDAVRRGSTVVLTGREEELSPFCGEILRFSEGELQTPAPDRSGSGNDAGSAWRLLVSGEKEAILRALERVGGIASCRFGKRLESGERFLDLVVLQTSGFEANLRDALENEGCRLCEMNREGGKRG